MLAIALACGRQRRDAISGKTEKGVEEEEEAGDNKLRRPVGGAG